MIVYFPAKQLFPVFCFGSVTGLKMNLNSWFSTKQLSNEEVREKISRFKKYEKFYFLFLVIWSPVFLWASFLSSTEFRHSFTFWFVRAFPLVIAMFVFEYISNRCRWICNFQSERVKEDLVQELKCIGKMAWRLGVVFALVFCFLCV